MDVAPSAIEALLPMLQRAAAYRALSLLFAPPDKHLDTELRGLAREVSGPLGEQILHLANNVPPDLSALYHQTLGPSGTCRDCESDYEVNALGGKGPLVADVAGFYRAFHYEPEGVVPASPDHIATELGFLGWLALKTAYALQRGAEDDTQVCLDAAKTFVQEHLGRWAPTFLARLADTAQGNFYEQAARVAATALETLEPGRLTPPRPADHRGPSLPVLDDSDECQLQQIRDPLPT